MSIEDAIKLLGDEGNVEEIIKMAEFLDNDGYLWLRLTPTRILPSNYQPLPPIHIPELDGLLSGWKEENEECLG